MGASDVDGPSGGLRVRLVDPLVIAQTRLEQYIKRHALEIDAEADLNVAEVAALVAIAQGLRALAANQVDQGPKNYTREEMPPPPVHIPAGACTCYAIQDAGGGRTVERRHCPIHRSQ